MEERKGIISSVRNPLSIIALFVLFIEVVVCSALRIEFLTESQRNCIVLFCAVFPILVLLFFMVVVWFKPQNLYGPLDYDESKQFIDSLRMLKYETEALELENEDCPYFEPISSEKNVMVSKIITSEEFALKELQKEFNSEINRNVRTRNGRFVYDGVIKTTKGKIVVEIKYFKPDSPVELILRRFDSFLEISRDYDKRLLAIVTDSPIPSEMQELINKDFSRIDPDILVRFYSF